MADNVDITPGTGKTIAADDVSGVLYQRVKLVHGPDGEATDVHVGEGLPVNPTDSVMVIGEDTFDHAAGQDPVPAGGWGYADADPTAVSDDGDLTRILTDLQGRLWVRPLAADTFNVSDLIQRQALVKKTVDFTASQTAQTIWDPTGGTKFVVIQALLSFSAAGAITVFDGMDDTTNRIFKINGAANGGMAWTAAIPVISSTADNVLKYTTGSGAAGSLTVFGYEV